MIPVDYPALESAQRAFDRFALVHRGQCDRCPFATAQVRILNARVNQSTDTIREKYVHLLRLDKGDHLTQAVGRMIDYLPDPVAVGPVVRLRLFTGPVLAEEWAPFLKDPRVPQIGQVTRVT